MPAKLPTFERASFDGIEFSWRTRKVYMSNRIHEHIYLKVPGAAIEKMGRGLYRADFDGAFDANITGFGEDYYPGTLARLRALAESQKSARLVIPGIGSILATLEGWEQELDARITSGEKVPLKFLEDATQVALADALTKAAGASLETKTLTLLDLTAGVDPVMRPGRIDINDTEPTDNIFTQIQKAVNTVFGLQDQSKLYGSLVASRIDYLTNLIRKADEDVVALQDPSNYPIIEALQDLARAALDFKNTIAGTSQDPRVYVTPMTMSTSDISAAVYDGDGTLGGDIMLNNGFPDPFRVPAGERVIWFPKAA